MHEAADHMTNISDEKMSPDASFHSEARGRRKLSSVKKRNNVDDFFNESEIGRSLIKTPESFIQSFQVRDRQ